MKKTLTFALTALLCVTLTACTKKEETASANTPAPAAETTAPAEATPEPTPTPTPEPTPEPEPSADPITAYTGRYRCISMKQGTTDYTENLEKAWSDRSFYEFVEITEDNRLMIWLVQTGAQPECILDAVFDPATMTVSMTSDSSNTMELKADGDRLTISGPNQELVFEKTDEIDIELSKG